MAMNFISSDIIKIKHRMPHPACEFPVFVMVPGLTFSWQLKYHNRLKKKKKARKMSDFSDFVHFDLDVGRGQK